MTSPSHWAKSRASQMILKGLYEAYEEYASKRRDMACSKGCVACCTDRVLLTSLEADYLLTGLKESGREDLLQSLLAMEVKNGQRPVSTFNALARMCINQKEPPQDPEWGDEDRACPLLDKGECGIYSHRPLACRTMASKRRCLPGGEAVDDPWWITVNTVFFQLMEQASIGGGFGAMADVTRFIEGKSRGEGILWCEKLPGLPAPEEHQKRLTGFLEELFCRMVDSRPLGAWFEVL